jgi:hypothetical protein
MEHGGVDDVAEDAPPMNTDNTPQLNPQGPVSPHDAREYIPTGSRRTWGPDGDHTFQTLARQAACVAIETARLLKQVDHKTWRTRSARDAAMRESISQGRRNCAPATYDVRVEAVQGRDPVRGSLRISCRKGFELSPTSPPGAYIISFGALTPESSTSVTRTARTQTSYEIDYTIQPQTPAGGGIYLKGMCVPINAN